MVPRNRKKGRKNILIITSGLTENKGDQAILRANIYFMKKYLSNINIVIEDVFLDIFKSFQTIRHVYSANAVVLSVGHPVQDTTSKLFIPYVFSKIVLAILLSKKIFIFSAGVSDLKSKFLKKLVVIIMNKCSFISVRDEASKRLLEEFGVKKNIHISCDPALFCPNDIFSPQDISIQFGNYKPYICISPRRWFHYTSSFFPFKKVDAKYLPRIELYRNQLANLADGAVSRFNCNVILVPMRPGKIDQPGQDDDIFCNEILNNAKNKNNIIVIDSSINLSEIITLFRGAEAVVGVRMHSSILAAKTNTPFVNVYYNEKGLSFMTAMGMKNYAISIKDFSHEKVLDFLTDIFKNKKKIKNQMIRRKNVLYGKLLINYAKVREIIDRDPDYPSSS